ncbi:MAG: GTP 3',8-cyclase MoaA [Gammaproteobacteria bacterium]|nr:GTP 3',8-cyclase MoaA [Gammaproteobacteria bacterium]MCP5135369.1 GTP 3',8-cyclase MoaA [Gammaproteobacteria bacterium]
MPDPENHPRPFEAGSNDRRGSGRDVLIDPFGRRIDYLRLSVIDACNYRCVYCVPECGIAPTPAQGRLSAAELVRVARVFAGLGVGRIRLTGGEPLVRRDLVDIAARIAALDGVRDLSMSTNGHRLGQQAKALRAAGIGRVNVSLDSLDAERFATITRGGRLDSVLDGIEAARAAGMAPIKINMVVMAGENDDELEAMLDFTRADELELRFIEAMPVGDAGETAATRRIDAAAILERVRVWGGGDLIPATTSCGGGPARMFRFPGGRGTVGVISAVSRHFCATCNRVRVTAEGDLLLCLGHEGAVSLREPMREGAGDAELAAIVRGAVARKPWGHEFDHAGAAHGVSPNQMLRTGG